MRLLLLVAIASLAAGCTGASLLTPGSVGPALGADQPTILPLTDFYNITGEPTRTKTFGILPAEPFHTFEEVEARVAMWNATQPGFVEVRTFGASILGRPMWDVVLTNEAILGPKPVVFIDGGHHGNEVAGTEMALYLIDFLLDNRATNATVAGWLDALEIHTVPIVNPDGYVDGTRGNALGVNLNRNYDLDWGNPLGASNLAMGTLAHATNQSMPSVSIVAENCGSGPFSEPESQAMRDLLAEVGSRLVVYLSYHTPTNALISPWAAYDAPFPLPPEHDALFERVLDWTRTNTSYRAGKAAWGNFSAGLPYSASGSSGDYVYATYEAASFTLEIEIWYTSITSEDYVQQVYLEPYKGLRYWLDASLPIPLFLLQNWEAIDAWDLPYAAPPLPAGTPPAPLPAYVKAALISPEPAEGAPTDPGRLLPSLPVAG
ncbi:MAG TPA: M14 family zinc carboxypeptidase [Candidatus Thermoplasmatota archaeon]|nr:M14 family zinc carboxypeptidase [Candidatus Thermoplasmatota archaeon]